MSQTKDNKNFGSGFLYAEDLIRNGTYREVNVVISAVYPPGTLKTAEGSFIDKTVIGFEGKDKKLCLCKTNQSILIYVCGHQAGEKWVGTTIKLQVRAIKAFGAVVPALRVIPPDGLKIRKKLIEGLGSKATLN